MKELTVKEISDLLGYEVKIVKEPVTNVPQYVNVGQVYLINNSKYMVAAIGDKEMGLISVGSFAGCYSSNILNGPATYEAMRKILISKNAKYLGTFNDVFKPVV